jgi:hypothetical protein
MEHRSARMMLAYAVQRLAARFLPQPPMPPKEAPVNDYEIGLRNRVAAMPASPFGVPIWRGSGRSLILAPTWVNLLCAALRSEHEGDGEPGMTGLYWELVRRVEA